MILKRILTCIVLFNLGNFTSLQIPKALTDCVSNQSEESSNSETESEEELAEDGCEELVQEMLHTLDRYFLMVVEVAKILPHASPITAVSKELLGVQYRRYYSLYEEIKNGKILPQKRDLAVAKKARAELNDVYERFLNFRVSAYTQQE